MLLIEVSHLVIQCSFWQLFSIMTTVTGLSLADSNGFFDTQAVATEASFIESAGTIDELGNPASTLDPQVGADDDWNEPVADISIKTNLIAPVIASIDDCSLAPKQHSRRKQRRQNGFCQNPDAPGILPLQPESNRKPRKRKGANFNSPTNEKKTDRNPPTLEINPVPTSDQNPCQPERHYQVCAARFFQVAPSSISLENRPWTEDSDLNPGDQIFCRLCKSASYSENSLS